MFHPVVGIQKATGNEALAASPHCFLLPESAVMGTLLGPELQALDSVLTEGVPIYTSCEMGQPLCYAILLLLTVNALVFIKMCFREVNIEETYIGIFLSWWLRHC